MNKHKLLREDILPAMASNRKVQRLLNEFMDLLSEYETTETNFEQKNLMDSNPPTTDEANFDPTQKNLVEPAVNAVDQTLQATNQMDIATPTDPQADVSLRNEVQAPEQMNIDPPAPVQVDDAKEKDS